MLLSHLKFDTSPTEDSGVGGYTWNAYQDFPAITTKDGRSCAYFNGTTTSLVCADPVFPNIKAWEEDWSVSLSFNTSVVTDTLCMISKLELYKLLLLSKMTTNFNVGKWNSLAVLHKNHTIYIFTLIAV